MGIKLNVSQQMSPCGKEGKLCPGLLETKYRQQVEGGDPAPPPGTHEATPVLRSEEKGTYWREPHQGP